MIRCLFVYKMFAKNPFTVFDFSRTYGLLFNGLSTVSGQLVCKIVCKLFSACTDTPDNGQYRAVFSPVPFLTKKRNYVKLKKIAYETGKTVLIAVQTHERRDANG
jgi:hypothetical protein